MVLSRRLERAYEAGTINATVPNKCKSLE
jgi:hypothetical protein